MNFDFEDLIKHFITQCFPICIMDSLLTKRDQCSMLIQRSLFDIFVHDIGKHRQTQADNILSLRAAVKREDNDVLLCRSSQCSRKHMHAPLTWKPLQ